jgi:hypothetical protein
MEMQEHPDSSLCASNEGVSHSLFYAVCAVWGKEAGGCARGIEADRDLRSR